MPAPDAPALLELEVEGTPEQVHARLDARVLRIRSVWFPTPRELRAWASTGSPLYLIWQGPSSFEVGPRLESMWAATFAPVLRGRLEALDHGHTRLVGRHAWPRVTLVLLSIWWLAVVGWGVALFAMPPDERVGWLPWWGLLAAFTTLGPWVGYRLGGAALRQQLGWLAQQASEPSVAEEDW